MSKMDVRLHMINTSRNQGYWNGIGRLDSEQDRTNGYASPEYWANRIYAELTYGQKLSDIRGGKYDDLLVQAADYIVGKIQSEGSISMEAAQHAESMIACLKDDAKSFTLICCAHAHIDMNWMWGFDETVAVTLDTFATMLDLMDEYPEFKFSQSQASTYKIVEDYGPPHMLERIAQRAQEGRWEPTTATWVEADKNTPNAESMARHLLYTRRYISKLLGIDGKKLQLDFEPDTFGHSANVPELLNKAGIKYYYHCRGSHDPQLCWWTAPSGAKVLSFREAMGYNAVVDETLATQMLEPCKDLGIDTMIRVYGVGDHGGGPSRRDIERIMEMREWPVYPTIRFGTYAEFFSIIEQKFGDKLPVRNEEMNFVFTGCYTTQTRIKMANRIGEATLNEAEAFASFANLETGVPYPAVRFQDAWTKLLFNQFHDILTGSGVINTREYALGQFQQTMAAANTAKLTAIRAIASKIDTSKYVSDEPKGVFRTEGAGVGSGVEEYKISQVDRGCGSTRVYHFFNAAPFDRSESVELTIWDWSQAELNLMEFRDAAGNKVECQLISSGVEWYWFHEYVKVLLKVDVPALGYATYTLTKSDDTLLVPHDKLKGYDQRVEEPHEYVLENDFLRAEFDVQSGVLVSLLDKKTGMEMVDAEWGSGIFRLVEEDTDRGMTSWRVGRHMNLKEFCEDVHIKHVGYQGANLRQSISIETKFGRSSFKAIISLDYDSPTLKYDVECDWHEVGKMDDKIPQLNFFVPVAYPCRCYKYDVPAGTLDREATDMDLPGNSFIVGMPAEGNRGIMVSSDTKYGFRGFEDSMAVDLIRSSYEPDPYPEYGVHKMKLAIAVVDTDKPRALIEKAYALWHPLNSIAAQAHAGSLPMSGSFLSLGCGNAALQAIKMPEEGGNSLILRLYETDGQDGSATVKLWQAPKSAQTVDLHEEPCAGSVQIQGQDVVVAMPANQVVSVRIDF